MNEQNDYNEPQARMYLRRESGDVLQSMHFYRILTFTFIVGGEVNTITDKLLSACPAWEAGV